MDAALRQIIDNAEGGSESLSVHDQARTAFIEELRRTQPVARADRSQDPVKAFVAALRDLSEPAATRTDAAPQP